MEKPTRNKNGAGDLAAVRDRTYAAGRETARRGIPVIYMPGVSRQLLRAVEECPPELQPLGAYETLDFSALAILFRNFFKSPLVDSSTRRTD